MIYKCPKCGSEITYEDEGECGTGTDCKCRFCFCGYFSGDESCNAKNYARLLDSERWRKIREEPPEEGEVYSLILVKNDYGEIDLIMPRSLTDFDEHYWLVSPYKNAEWRPVYGFERDES